MKPWPIIFWAAAVITACRGEQPTPPPMYERTAAPVLQLADGTWLTACGAERFAR